MSHDHFDKQKLYNLFKTADLSNSKIKKISSYLIAHSEYASDIVKLWKTCFDSTKSLDLKLSLFYIAHDSMNQSAIKANSCYVIEFGDILLDIIRGLSESINSINLIRKIIKIIYLWKNKLFYTQSYVDELLKVLNERENFIYHSDPKIKFNENIIKEEILNINKNPNLKIQFELDILEKNIKEKYEILDKNKLNNILTSNDESNITNNQILVKEYQERINNLKKLLLSDICKRENYICTLTDFLNKEKNSFFQLNNK